MSTPKQSNIDRVTTAIRDQAMTIPNLADAACLSQPCVQAVLRLLRDQGDAHIERWIKIGSGVMYRWIAAYRCGAGKDATKPPVETAEQKKARNRLYRQRAAQKKLEMANVVNPFRHPQDEAFFGPAPRVFSNNGKPVVRVFRQPMTVTNDELETA